MDKTTTDIYKILLKITVDLYMSDMKRLENKRTETVNAEFVDKVVAILQKDYPDFLNPEELEMLRQNFLKQSFGS